jgi:dihydroneopterin aldolase
VDDLEPLAAGSANRRQGAERVRIEVVGLSVYTHHGVEESEREVGQRLVLDVALEVDECAATASDELADTVDYGAVAREVAEAAGERSYRTLERLCAAVADRVLERYEPDSVTVRAAKPEPPMAPVVDEVAVELTRGRG